MIAKVTYNWEEEDVDSAPSSAPKREQIAPDVFLYTTRRDNPTCFIYHLDCMKYKQVAFTMDFLGSSNFQLLTGGLQITSIVKPYEKVGQLTWFRFIARVQRRDSAARAISKLPELTHCPSTVCALVFVCLLLQRVQREVARLIIQDPSMPWTLKAKYSWSEQDVIGVTGASSSSSGGRVKRRGSFNSIYQKTESGWRTSEAKSPTKYSDPYVVCLTPVGCTKERWRGEAEREAGFACGMDSRVVCRSGTG